VKTLARRLLEGTIGLPPQEFIATLQKWLGQHVFKKRHWQRGNRLEFDHVEMKSHRGERAGIYSVVMYAPEREDNHTIDNMLECLGITPRQWLSTNLEERHIEDAFPIFDQIARTMGYFVKGTFWKQGDKYGENYKGITFESMHGIPVATPRRLYHFAPSKNETTILKNGLEPRERAQYDEFKHPARVYVLDKTVGIVPMAKRIYGGDETEFSVFQIDATMTNAEFVKDLATISKSYNGYWTQSHIPANTISVINRFTLSNEWPFREIKT
jgi:hypothetical protein